MKLLFVFSAIPPYLDALLNKISAKGQEVVVAIAAKESTVIGKGVKIVDEHKSDYKLIPTREATSILGKKYFPDLYNIIESEKPDILIAGWPYFLALSFQPKLRRAVKRNKVRVAIREIPFQTPPYGRIKEYFDLHPMYDEDMNLQSQGLAFYIRQWVVMNIRRYCYKLADGALAYSSVGKDIMPTYGVDKELVFVTYNTGNSEALMLEKENVIASKPILPHNANRIIHIGRLVKWKRVDLLIDSFAIVLEKYPHAELVVIGEGPEREALELMVQNMGIEQNIIFVGAIYDPIMIGAYMHSSSVYVLAGMGGLSINDAMAYGLPVICSVCDGTEIDLIEDGVNGFFFEEGNKHDLANKIVTLFENPAQLKNMGQEALRVIEEKINLETVSNRFINAFNKINSL